MASLKQAASLFASGERGGNDDGRFDLPAPRCGETLPEVEPHLLECDGNLDKCQIPVESQLDIH
jgi:hypothetical protein